MGNAARIAPAKCTLYSLTPVDDCTRLFKATVIGWLEKSANDAPNRKSFQMFVNCQMTETTMIGPELGRRMRQNIWKKPAVLSKKEETLNFRKVRKAMHWLES